MMYSMLDQITQWAEAHPRGVRLILLLALSIFWYMVGASCVG